MRFDRRSGVFLHVTSLPGPGGIGDLGEGARAFVEYLAEAGQTYWQICPLGPTSTVHGNSPYQSYSAFAGNPLVISLDALVDRGWLDEHRLTARPTDPHWVEYERVSEFKHARLREAWHRFQETATERDRAAFDRFREAESGWLDEYATFVAVKRNLDERAWTDWPTPIKRRDPAALTRYRDRLEDERRYHEFVQFCFDRQWRALKRYATDRGIEIIGDMPLYVALDSADVWANPDRFALGPDHEPAAVAGVPPDLGTDGQVWGNPLYDWDRLRESGFEWWIARFERLYDLVDVVRLDHFKGFEQYWAVPAGGAPEDGEWRTAPGDALFRTLESTLGELPAIAENLGHVSEGVESLRRRFDLPGMVVPQYADWCTEDHMYLPHNFDPDAVAYTSTHDTDTVVGWYRSLSDEQRDCLHYYLDTDGDAINWDLLDAVWGSDAVVAMTQLQDLLALGSETRFNTPGTASGNWTWRVTEAGLDGEIAARLRDCTERYGRSR